MKFDGKSSPYKLLATWLRGYVATWPRGDVATGLRGQVATWLRGHMAMWPHGHVAMWLRGYGCLDPNLELDVGAWINPAGYQE